MRRIVYTELRRARAIKFYNGGMHGTFDFLPLGWLGGDPNLVGCKRDLVKNQMSCACYAF
ncbi:MAG: hypothetical protein A2932_01975 [Candidatus Spechtbacteria bacterium RIFCSPLOWO2_01_FULL_46_10]|uniref:Uncharacterized protein n=1 Tax=Candidatus Spechtbacteria bacterium RIFCSPLOWO2_01_FULL_46_10 TaxID=1802163 RepID=A0A1G2HEB9_9BACT|nr:MAG: hypothetical protein A2932_01975 [Candidatus Spechtbacteria bacterium RIFCSPLOWO2_01_FULL_46_10]